MPGRSFLVIIFVALSHFCFAQTANNTRPPFTLKLMLDDNKPYQISVGATPYIFQNDIVTLFCGEKLYVEADVANNKLVNMHVVPEITHKEKTVIIEFYQERKDAVRNHMILSIYNPYGKYLAYKSQFTRIREESSTTSPVTPVKPGKVAFETWPDFIKTMSLYDFVLKGQ